MRAAPPPTSSCSPSVSYAPVVTNRAASNIDASGLSLLQRYAAMGAAMAKEQGGSTATEASFPGSSSSAAGSQGSGAASSSSGVGSGAAASAGASPIASSRAAEPSATSARASLPSSEPQPSRGGPSTPANGGQPAIDIIAQRSRTRARDSAGFDLAAAVAEATVFAAGRDSAGSLRVRDCDSKGT